MRVVQILVLICIAIILVALIVFILDTDGDRCASYCYPDRSDLMDTGTCACWGDKIEIIDLADLP